MVHTGGKTAIPGHLGPSQDAGRNVEEVLVVIHAGMSVKSM